ncbi:MAG: cyanophycin synthetase [Ignavibacteria bacterium]|nr:cyanophycin synthetase [Ignavibacteria bacterium]
MDIIDIRILRGPNYWSNYRKKLIHMRLDLGNSAETSSNEIPGFPERLEKFMPSLNSHRCSEQDEGGFFHRVRTGTLLGHVIEHVALELQSLAGMECGFGRTRSANGKGCYHVVFDYEIEKAGIYAAKAAVRIIESLRDDLPYDLESDLIELNKIAFRESLGPSTSAIIKEAQKKDIPFRRLDNRSLIMLGHGINQKKIRATIFSTTSSIAVETVSDKELTRKLLSDQCIPFPKGVVLEGEDELISAIEEIGFSVVIKPNNGNHGRGITTCVNSYKDVIEAFRIAKTVSDEVIIEKHIEGSDYRFLLINYKLVAVSKRLPAMVKGDGISSIQKLIDNVNLDPHRGLHHEKILTRITVDENTMNILKRKNLTVNSILPEGQVLNLKYTANISSGGTAADVTAIVHPHNVALAERIARLIELNICGLDIIAKDITIPIDENTGALLEINASPGLRMHLSPSEGVRRNVASPIIEMLFPDNADGRIPIVAVTGTNGKTTVTRLIAYIARAVEYVVGFTTTDGIYIDGKIIGRGDCSGPESAGVILRDSKVDFAVLECARGGILRAGLGFDKCSVSIVTNVTSDHLGLKDIETIEDLAHVKSVVPKSTIDNGYAILNADDDLVYNMKEDLDCNVGLFSVDADNERIREHCSKGGLAAITENNCFVICKGNSKIKIAEITEVPLTFSGASECNIKNVLPSILASYVNNISPQQITQCLKTFIPSPEFTPGRMNLFRFKKFKVLLDYAHNEGAYLELKKYMDHISAIVKVGVISVPGDRRDGDLRKLGFYAGQIFNEIIIKHDIVRTKNNQQITDLLTEGIREANEGVKTRVISNESNAVKYALENAKEDSFIFVCANDVTNVIQQVTEALKIENEAGKIHSLNEIPSVNEILSDNGMFSDNEIQLAMSKKANSYLADNSSYWVDVSRRIE